MARSENITVRLRENTYRRLKAFAADRGMSMAEAATRFLERGAGLDPLRKSISTNPEPVEINYQSGADILVGSRDSAGNITWVDAPGNRGT
jgi:hypothetical protein